MGAMWLTWENKQDKGSDEDQGKNEEKEGDNGDQNESSEQPQISKEQAKRMLEAANKKEKDIQDRINKNKKVVGKKTDGKSTTKKDW